MADDKPLVVYAGSYEDGFAAEADFRDIKAAHHAGLIGKYDSALFTREADGKIKVLNTDSTTRAKGAKWGLVTGAVVGLLFPPSLIAGLIWGGGIGTLVGHLAKGWSHKDIKELGETLEVGHSGVVLIAETPSDLAAELILKRATKSQMKEIKDNASEIRTALDDD
jgi:uncharacterized membrane protein